MFILMTTIVPMALKSCTLQLLIAYYDGPILGHVGPKKTSNLFFMLIILIT
jgi:hypothetical protein